MQIVVTITSYVTILITKFVKARKNIGKAFIRAFIYSWASDFKTRFSFLIRANVINGKPGNGIVSWKAERAIMEGLFLLEQQCLPGLH